MLISFRQYIRILALLAFGLLSGLSACIGPKGPANGRFLYTNSMSFCGEGGQFSFFEYKAGMKSPTPIWTGIPCKPNSFISKWIISPDRHYAIFIIDGDSLDLVLLNLLTGDYKNLPLPDIEFESIRVNGAISPDNRFLAYSVNKMLPNYSNPWLYLVDLEAGTDSVLYENPCAYYKSFRDLYGGNVCATIGIPQWIDNTTIVFSGYAGDMPESNVSGSTIDPNRTFVMDINGNILQEFSPALTIGGIFGPNLLFYYDEKIEEGYKWLDTTDLKQGVIKPHLLNTNSQFVAGHIGESGYLKLPFISPDGQFAFQRIDGIWHLIGLRSGSDIEVRNTWAYLCLSAVWSPDQKNIKCDDDIISLEGLADRKSLDTSQYSFFAWLP